MRDGRACVYRFYDDGGAVLYVGETKSLGKRLYNHSTTASWWPKVARAEVEWVVNKVAALAEEARQIGVHLPPFNKRMHPMKRRGVFIKVRVSEAERRKYATLAEAMNRPLGEIIRDALDDFAKRVEKERSASE